MAFKTYSTTSLSCCFGVLGLERAQTTIAFELCCTEQLAEGGIGGFSMPQHRKKINKNTASPQEKLTKHRHRDIFSESHDSHGLYEFLKTGKMPTCDTIFRKNKQSGLSATFEIAGKNF